MGGRSWAAGRAGVSMTTLTAHDYHLMPQHERDQVDAWLEENSINKHWLRQLTFGEGFVQALAYDARDGQPYLLADDGTDWNSAPREHPKDKPHAATVETTITLSTPPPPVLLPYLR